MHFRCCNLIRVFSKDVWIVGNIFSTTQHVGNKTKNLQLFVDYLISDANYPELATVQYVIFRFRPTRRTAKLLLTRRHSSSLMAPPTDFANVNYF